MRDLALFVQVPKTGSTSMRRLFHTAAADDASSASRAPWLCQRNADVSWPCDSSAEVVLGGAWVYGTGDVYSPAGGRVGARPPRAHHAARAHRAHAQRVRILLPRVRRPRQVQGRHGHGLQRQPVVRRLGRTHGQPLRASLFGVPAARRAHARRVDRRRGRGVARAGGAGRGARARHAHPPLDAGAVAGDGPGRRARRAARRPGAAARVARRGGRVARGGGARQRHGLPARERRAAGGAVHTHRGRAARRARPTGQTARSTRG